MLTAFVKIDRVEPRAVLALLNALVELLTGGERKQ